MEKPIPDSDSMIQWLTARRQGIFLILALALAAYHGLVILTFALARIDGVLHVLVDDDVMISLRYARNLVRGLGLVYNEGERVEGFTNPLLTAVAAGLHLLSLPAPVLPLGLEIMNLALGLGILWILIRFWGETPEQRVAGLLAGAFYVLGPQHLFFGYAGYEVYMQAAMILYCAWRIERMGFREALVLGLVPLTHGTSLAAWGVLCVAFAAFYRGPQLRLCMLGIVAAAPLVGYELFRIAYYGELLPNTYWLKVGAGSLKGGLLYVRGWVVAIFPLAALGILPLVWSLKDGIAGGLRRVRAVLARTRTAQQDEPVPGHAVAAAGVCAVHILSVIVLGGDYFPQSRFLFPCTVLLAPFAGWGVVLLLDWLARVPAAPARRALAFGLALPAVATLALPFLNYARAQEDLRDIRRWNIEHLSLGKALRDNTQPDAVVALFGLGYAGYYSDRRCIDMLGKADRHIARTKPHPGRRMAHNKSDFGYVLERSPDVIEMKLSPSQLANIPRLTQDSRENPHGHTAELALWPGFRRRYAPHPILDGKGRWLPLYARDRAARHPWRIAEEFFRSSAR